jgi:hypothetical protein
LIHVFFYYKTCTSNYNATNLMYTKMSIRIKIIIFWCHFFWSNFSIGGWSFCGNGGVWTCLCGLQKKKIKQTLYTYTCMNRGNISSQKECTLKVSCRKFTRAFSSLDVDSIRNSQADLLSLSCSKNVIFGKEIVIPISEPISVVIGTDAPERKL